MRSSISYTYNLLIIPCCMQVDTYAQSDLYILELIQRSQQSNNLFSVFLSLPPDFDPLIDPAASLHPASVCSDLPRGRS